MTHRKIELPAESAGMTLVASVSGGKDSTALALALREAGLPYRMVFADTGWEAQETYDHLEYLRTVLGPIAVVGHEGGMLGVAERKAGFPQRAGRWCTETLKLKPLRAYHDELERGGVETVSVVGVRADESEARARMPIWEDDALWKGYMWRPLLHWSVDDVLAIHHRHGVRVHPLYLRGHNRVGCYPCIMANKEEVRLIAEHDPARIEQIAQLERDQSTERRRRNDSGEGNFKHLQSTFFSARDQLGPRSIDEVVTWSKTARGGKQLPLLAPTPDGGCFRWGLCEAPKKDGADE